MLAALRPPLISLLATLALVLSVLSPPAHAADQARLRAYLEVPGFDVALESIRLSADNAPAMLGIEADAFGSEWSRLVKDIFATDLMNDMALEILGKTLSDDLLTHAADFYASDLGQRLVAVENDSHMIEEEGLKSEDGGAIVDGLERIDSPRITLLRQLIDATDADGASLKAIQEVQVRFLMAAAGAGVIELRMDEADLREAMRGQEDELRAAIADSALRNAAYTYQAFSDDEIATYTDALEDPRMQKVYALMNAVQYEIMANRFEAVAARLSHMQPSTDL